MMQKIVCSLLVFMYAQLAYTAAAQVITYNVDMAQKELREIKNRFSLDTMDVHFFEAVRYPKWHNAAQYLLAEKKVDINSPTAYLHWTFLILASCHGEEKSVRWLLNNKAEVNQCDAAGNTALWHACLGDVSGGCSPSYYSIIKLLLKNGAHVNVQNASGETPVMAVIESSVYHDHGPHRPIAEKIIKLLLRAGADLSLKNNSGVSVFNDATKKHWVNSSLRPLEGKAQRRHMIYKTYAHSYAHLELKSMLVAYCKLDEKNLADMIAAYVGDDLELFPPLNWEIGMPVIKQPEKARSRPLIRQAKKVSGCVIS